MHGDKVGTKPPHPWPPLLASHQGTVEGGKNLQLSIKLYLLKLLHVNEPVSFLDESILVIESDLHTLWGLLEYFNQAAKKTRPSEKMSVRSRSTK